MSNLLNKTISDGSDGFGWRLARPVERNPGENLYRLTRKAEQIHPSYAKTLLEANDDATVTNPVADGVTYRPDAQNDWVFAVSRVWAEDEQDEAITITQSLTRITSVAEAANLPTAVKLADREVLNYLGIVEGLREHIYHRYPNLNPASRAACMNPSTTVVSETNYAEVKREFKVYPETNTATLFVVFKKLSWPIDNEAGDADDVWADDKVLMQTDSPGGHGKRQHHSLTGIDSGNYATVFAAAQSADTGYVVDLARLVERAEGEYAVDRVQGVTYSGTADGDAVVTMIKSSLGGKQLRALRRVWWRRTSAARTTLITAGTGNAVTGYTYETIAYTHDRVEVTDHGDGAYTVVQYLADLSDDVNVYFTTSNSYGKLETNLAADEWRILTFTDHLSIKSNLRDAWDFIGAKHDPGNDNYVVAKSVHRRDRFVFEAFCTVFNTSTGFGAWT